MVEDLGHTVAVIDRDPEAFRRLRSSTAKSAVDGTGHDRDALLRAGISNADAFAAVSSGDNSNIIAARVARETFGVRLVVARIYDPRRAEVYQRLGIPTVGTVRWTADTIWRHLFPADPDKEPSGAPEWRDTSGSPVLVGTAVHDNWAGTSVDRVETELNVRVGFLTRGGHNVLARGAEPLREDDVLHLLAHDNDATSAIARLRSGETESEDQ